MYEAKGEEIWYNEGSVKGLTYARILTPFVDTMFPDAKFRGVKPTTHLYVLKHTNAPANLVECGFIDRVADWTKLGVVSNLNEMANILVEGIRDIVRKEV
jgi:N-acetylmuramoyl-L-alanine amidase